MIHHPSQVTNNYVVDVDVLAIIISWISAHIQLGMARLYLLGKILLYGSGCLCHVAYMRSKVN